jgi:phosphoserine phosphatase RsbU/P
VLQQAAPALVPRNIADLFLASVILFVALAAMAVWLFRSRRKERILLWFGLLALIYGLRELIKNPLVRLTFGITQYWRDYLVSWGDFLVMIPAVLVIEDIFGRGWRSSIRWANWILAAYGVVGIALGLVTNRPYDIPEPARTILAPLVVAVLLINVAKRYQPPPFPDIRIFLLGVGIFIAFILDDHFAPPPYHAEPVGFLALICSFGIIAVRRTIRNESRLVSIEQELASARRIQAAILPAHVPSVPQLTIAARYSPMTAVAGDFYDFATIDSTRIGVLVADVAGHGIPAALIASMVKVGFAAQQPHAADPSLVLCGLNQIFCSQLHGQYVTACYLSIDAATGSAVYSGAGHPPLIVWRAAREEVERYENNGFFLGFKRDEVYPKVEVQLSPRDRLILYTDGLLEATNHADEIFADQLDERIAAYGDLPASSFADALLADLHAWTARSHEHHQEDDLTLLVIDVSAESAGGDQTTRLRTVAA